MATRSSVEITSSPSVSVSTIGSKISEIISDKCIFIPTCPPATDLVGGIVPDPFFHPLWSLYNKDTGQTDRLSPIIVSLILSWCSQFFPILNILAIMATWPLSLVWASFNSSHPTIRSSFTCLLPDSSYALLDMMANLPDLSVGTTTISPFLTLSVSDLSPLSCFLDKLLGCFPPFLHFSFKNFLNSAKACTLNVSILASVSKFFDLFGKITLALPFRSVVLLLLRFIERFSGSNTSLDLASSICFSSSISALIFWFSSSVKSNSIFLYASSSGFSVSPPSLIISHRSFITHSSTSHRNISSHNLFLTLNFGPSERRSFSSSLILISSSSSNLTRQGTYSSIFSCS